MKPELLTPGFSCCQHPSLRVRCRARKAAFSLIEVVMAIGVVSFAMLSTLGTFGVGLNMIQDAKSEMTHAQIISQVSSTVLQTPFNNLESYASDGPFYFDETGRQQTLNTGALYTAALVVTPGSSSTFPGASTDLAFSAKRVLITVSTVRPGTTNAISSSRAVLIVPKS
jgi:uncharacterized protein (TIGR02598 family)